MDEQELRKSIGQRIKKAREKMGWSQIELGKKLGKESSSVSSYESGTRTLKIADLPRLANLLNVSITYLFGEDESIEDLIAVARQLDRASRRIILSYAEELLETYKTESPHLLNPSYLTLERDHGDGTRSIIRVMPGETIDDLLKDGWQLVDPKED